MNDRPQNEVERRRLSLQDMGSVCVPGGTLWPPMLESLVDAALLIWQAGVGDTRWRMACDFITGARDKWYRGYRDRGQRATLRMAEMLGIRDTLETPMEESILRWVEEQVHRAEGPLPPNNSKKK